MPITYTFDRPLPLDAVQRLLAQTDWAAHRSPADLQTMLAGSVCVGAWQADRLVGFARVITDGVYRALLEDVVVDESLRGQGIGRVLVERLLERLAHVQQILLVCGDHLIPFYDQFGFERMPLPVMQLWRG
jgi:predicted GNAT family N-acyltransferase